jgi:hypothetical protein
MIAALTASPRMAEATLATMRMSTRGRKGNSPPLIHRRPAIGCSTHVRAAAVAEPRVGGLEPRHSASPRPGRLRRHHVVRSPPLPSRSPTGGGLLGRPVRARAPARAAVESPASRVIRGLGPGRAPRRHHSASSRPYGLFGGNARPGGTSRSRAAEAEGSTGEPDLGKSRAPQHLDGAAPAKAPRSSRLAAASWRGWPRPSARVAAQVGDHARVPRIEPMARLEGGGGAAVRRSVAAVPEGGTTSSGPGRPRSRLVSVDGVAPRHGHSV